MSDQCLVVGRVDIERRSRLVGKIGAKIRTDTEVLRWAIPKFTTDSLQYRETVDMAITNAIGDDEKRQQPVVDQCDTPRTKGCCDCRVFRT